MQNKKFSNLFPYTTDYFSSSNISKVQNIQVNKKGTDRKDLGRETEEERKTASMDKLHPLIKNHEEH